MDETALTTSIPLDAKYRPYLPEQLVGQDDPLRIFRAYERAAAPPAFLLHGPPGVGKTSWARMFILARNCESTGSRPCGHCTTCKNGASALNFRELSAARWDDPQVAKEVEELMGIVPWNNFGIFVDEVHAWSGKTADIVLKEIERPREGRYFIAATTELERVRPALRSRCVIVKFRRVSAAVLLQLAKRICQQESMSYEPAALEIIADQADGSPRELVKGLEAVSQRGHITREVVKAALSLDWTVNLLCFGDALIAGNLADQLDALEHWQ